MAFGEYWDTCEYTDGVLNYNQVSQPALTGRDIPSATHVLSYLTCV